MFDSKSDFKYYKLDSCYIGFIVLFYFLLEDSDLLWSVIMIILILYCCIIKFPQILQLKTVNIHFLTQFQKVDNPGMVLLSQCGSLWVSSEVAVKLLARAGGCRVA